MRYLVTSDLHLGSHFCNSRLFVEMLQKLDSSVILVLNGDIIDAPGKLLPVEHQQALKAIEARAKLAKVIWIEGNHDEAYFPVVSKGLDYAKSFGIGKRVFITHGDKFDKVMPRNRRFIQVFKLFHKLRIYLGANPVHVADYAKRFTYLYNFLRRKVMFCAVDYGKQHKVGCVVCGHVHYAEDTIHEDIRYINLGAWTESPCYCLLIDETNIELTKVENALKNQGWFTQGVG